MKKILIILAILNCCNSFIKNNNVIINRKKVPQMVSLQTAELEVLDKLQNKILSNVQPQISNQILSSFDGSLNSIYDIIKVFESYLIENALLDADYLLQIYTISREILSNPITPPLFLIINIFLILIGVGQDDSKVGSPYNEGETSYSVSKADIFYSSRPLYIFRRLLKLGQITGLFNIKLLLDWRFGNLEKNQKERAKEALQLATQLGPTFIKLGQALSIRTDLIPEAYALELRQLQDAVPPFPNEQAKEIIRKELGISDLNQVFKTISSTSIASASIGQVYKGTLLNGMEVAIKVQRPQILGEIALDLYLLRLLTPFQVRLSNAINRVKTTQDDIDLAVSLVDEWGRGFVAEVDYRLEAKNAKNFIDAMRNRGLSYVVTAPGVVDELSGPRVIVTEWVQGTRLDVDSSPDVPRLCSVAINAYLTMLLDTGVLHCDPHPGNLLRTTDGKLCILDWGMTLQVPKDLQYALLEFIAHINVEDFDALPSDFVNLGFSPSNKLEQLRSSGLTEGLSFALRQLNKGGGPAKIRERVKSEFKDRYGQNLSDEELRAAAREEMIDNMKNQLKKEGVDVNGVTNIMEEMSRRNRQLFKLPPYVLYVSRAFSTLEGIGLSINEDYSILQECYPYLASRLLKDDSPRAKNALRAMLFGSNTTGVINPNKFIEMTQNFESFESFSLSTDNEMEGRSKAQDALRDVFLSSEGNYVQDLLLEQAATITDSLLRESYDILKQSSGGKILKNVVKSQMNLIDSIPLPETLKTPVSLPFQVLMSIDDLIKKDENDQVAIDSAKILWESIQPRLAKVLSQSDNQTIIDSISKIPITSITSDPLKTTSAILNITRKYGAATLKRAADRFESRVISPNKISSISELKSFQVNSNDNNYNKDTISRNIGNSISNIAVKTTRNLEKILTPSEIKNEDDN